MADIMANNCNNEDGLEDCRHLLSTGQYEVLVRSEDGQRFVFPITQPEIVKCLNEGCQRIISTIDDFLEVKISTVFKRGYFSWEPTDSFILNMRPNRVPSSEDYRKNGYVGRFSYEPVSQEFLPAPLSVAHNSTIHRFGNHKFNEYVRGIYFKDLHQVLLRPYFNPLDNEGKFNPYGYYDPIIDEEKTSKTIQMLLLNGMPKSTDIIIKVNNDLVRKYSSFI